MISIAAPLIWLLVAVLVCDVCGFQGTKRLQAGARGCDLMCSPKMRKIQYARADIAMNMICDEGAVMITIVMMIASILMKPTLSALAFCQTSTPTQYGIEQNKIPNNSNNTINGNVINSNNSATHATAAAATCESVNALEFVPILS